MSTTLSALLPVVLLIALGFGLRASGMFPPAAWPPVERLIYLVLFPSLLFLEIARAPLTDQPLGRLAGVLLSTQLTMVAFAWAARRALRAPGPAYTSLLQAVVRWNSYIALSLAAPLFGAGAPPLMALAVALLVPTANVISVIALTRHSTPAPGAATGVLRSLLTNPLILACVAGVVWNLLGPTLPRPAAAILGMLAQATLPLGLLIVGAALQPRVLGAQPLLILVATVGKLVVKPALALFLCWALGVEEAARGVALLACAMPSASSSYILARLMGGDAPLMAAILTAQTLAAAITLPLVLAVAL